MLLAPAGLQQMRFNVLRCIRQLSDIAQPPTIWKGMTDKVAEEVAVYLESNQTAAVKEASAQVSLHCMMCCSHQLHTCKLQL